MGETVMVAIAVKKSTTEARIGLVVSDVDRLMNAQSKARARYKTESVACCPYVEAEKDSCSSGRADNAVPRLG